MIFSRTWRLTDLHFIHGKNRGLIDRKEKFFYGVHVSETNKCLFQTREKVRKRTALHPGDMGADDVDYEMQFPKDPEMLMFIGLTLLKDQKRLDRYIAEFQAPVKKYKSEM